MSTNRKVTAAKRQRETDQRERVKAREQRRDDRRARIRDRASDPHRPPAVPIEPANTSGYEPVGPTSIAELRARAAAKREEDAFDRIVDPDE